MRYDVRFGGDEGDRTLYLLTASQALSQMSYTPKTICALYYRRRLFVNCFWRNQYMFSFIIVENDCLLRNHELS